MALFDTHPQRLYRGEVEGGDRTHLLTDKSGSAGGMGVPPTPVPPSMTETVSGFTRAEQGRARGKRRGQTSRP